MAHLRARLFQNAISKWTMQSAPGYHRQCYVIINCYISSDALLNEINASVNNKMRKSKQSSNKKPKIKDRSNPNNKSLIQKSVSLINTTKPSQSLKQRENDYLSRIKSINSNKSLSAKSMFDKFGTFKL